MQCCGSGMFIPEPGSRILTFTHPGSKNSKKRGGWKKICCHNFIFSHKFHKNANYFSFEVLKKKIWANFQRIIELFTQKIVSKLSKIWVWNPGSGKNLFRIPGSKRHRIPDPQHWLNVYNCSIVSWFYHQKPGPGSGFFKKTGFIFGLTKICESCNDPKTKASLLFKQFGNGKISHFYVLPKDFLSETRGSFFTSPLQGTVLAPLVCFNAHSRGLGGMGH